MQVFHIASKECYDWLRNHPNVKEESITDWLLYRLSQMTDKIRYITFTRNEEASSGADWEWWILTRLGKETVGYRFLVQAKKLKAHKDNYAGLCYSNKNGFQIDLLQENAKERGALPVYAMYSSQIPDYKEQLKNYDEDFRSLIKWCEGCLNGVHLLSAQRVEKILFSQQRQKAIDQDVLNQSLKLSLLDSLFFATCGEPHRLYKGCWQKAKLGDRLLADYPFFYRENDIPRYVRILQQTQQEDTSWIEREFSRDFDNTPLAGVGVIDALLRPFF